MFRTEPAHWQEARRLFVVWIAVFRCSLFTLTALYCEISATGRSAVARSQAALAARRRQVRRPAAGRRCRQRHPLLSGPRACPPEAVPVRLLMSAANTSAVQTANTSAVPAARVWVWCRPRSRCPVGLTRTPVHTGNKVRPRPPTVTWSAAGLSGSAAVTVPLAVPLSLYLRRLHCHCVSAVPLSLYLCF